jgi:hypothetical protein
MLKSRKKIAAEKDLKRKTMSTRANNKYSLPGSWDKDDRIAKYNEVKSLTIQCKRLEKKNNSKKRIKKSN